MSLPVDSWYFPAGKLKKFIGKITRKFRFCRKPLHRADKDSIKANPSDEDQSNIGFGREIGMQKSQILEKVFPNYFQDQIDDREMWWQCYS